MRNQFKVKFHNITQQCTTDVKTVCRESVRFHLTTLTARSRLTMTLTTRLNVGWVALTKPHISLRILGVRHNLRIHVQKIHTVMQVPTCVLMKVCTSIHCVNRVNTFMLTVGIFNTTYKWDNDSVVSASGEILNSILVYPLGDRIITLQSHTHLPHTEQLDPHTHIPLSTTLVLCSTNYRCVS